MSPSTLNYDFPFPDGDSPVLTSGDFERLAKALDSKMFQLLGDMLDQTATTLNTGHNLDTLDNGIYSVWNGGVAGELGLPNNTLGVVLSFRYGASGGMQMWVPRRFGSPELWIRNSLSDGWTEWGEIGDSGGSSGGGLGDGSTTSGFKTVPLALTRGNGGGSTAETSAAVRIPMQFNAEITRWRLHVVDGNPRFNLRKTTGINLRSIYLMPYNSVGTPTDRITLVAEGPDKAEGSRDDLVTEWFDEPIGGNVGRYLSIGYQATAAPVEMVGGCYVNVNYLNNGVMSMSGFSKRTGAPFDMWIEAETAAGTPVIASLGDSNSVGVGTDLPLHDDYLSVYCRRIGALPVHYGHSGDSLQHWEDPDQEKWNRWREGGLAPADAVLQMMGSNDLGAGNLTLDEMQRRFQVVTDIATEKVSPIVHVGLIKPRNSPPGNYQEMRQAYNDWLATMPAPAREVHDLSTPVSNTADTAILSEYNADGTHMNTAGHARLATSIVKPITRSVDSTLATFGWAGTPHASESIKYVGGREVARNRAVNPSFETSGSDGLVVGSEVTISDRTAVPERVTHGTYSAILSWIDDGSTSEVQGIVQQETDALPGQWVAVSVDVTTTSSGVLYAAGIISERNDSNNHIAHHYPGEYAQVGQDETTTFTYAIQMTDPNVAVSRAGLRFSSTPGTYSLPDAWGYIDGFHIAVADTEAEALKQVSEYFDGDTPSGSLIESLQKRVAKLELGTPEVHQQAIPLTDDWRTDVSSEVIAYRTGNVVTVVAWRLGSAEGVVPDGDTTTEVVAYSLPTGFRTFPRFTSITEDSRGSRAYLSGNTVAITAPSSSVSHHSFTFITPDDPII